MDSLEQRPSPEDAATALASFNDVSIISSVMAQMGYTLTYEIEETVRMAQQNSNLSIKFKALRHLRGLLKESAEMSGLTANVSQTIPGPNGGHMVFQAKQLAATLNPVKQTNSKELFNEQAQEESSVNRESSSSSIEDCIRISDAGGEQESGPDARIVPGQQDYIEAGDARRDGLPGCRQHDSGGDQSIPGLRQAEASIPAPGGGADDSCLGSEAQTDSGGGDG
ncbi:hypothetical protein LCGC14_0873470, partial [marine sediment metagenome]